MAVLLGLLGPFQTRAVSRPAFEAATLSLDRDVVAGITVVTAGGRKFAFSPVESSSGGLFGEIGGDVRLSSTFPSVFDSALAISLAPAPLTMDQNMDGGGAVVHVASDSAGLGLITAVNTNGNPIVVGKLQAGSSAGSVSPQFFSCFAGIFSTPLPPGILLPALLTANGGLQQFLLDDKFRNGLIPTLNGNRQMTIVSSDGTVYSPVNGQQFSDALADMRSKGQSVSDMTIKGHGSPESVDLGDEGDILIIPASGQIFILDVETDETMDITNDFNIVTDANSDIDIRACNTSQLAEKLDGALGGLPTVSGAPDPVLGIPYTDWVIGRWENF